MPQELFNRPIFTDFAAGTILAHEYSQREFPIGTFSINTFMKIPQVGEYILSKCRTQAYRVLRHQKANACGMQHTVIFLADPTEIVTSNPHGEHGMAINTHSNDCGCHCISVFYLKQRMGFPFNAELLN